MDSAAVVSRRSFLTAASVAPLAIASSKVATANLVDSPAPEVAASPPVERITAYALYDVDRDGAVAPWIGHVCESEETAQDVADAYAHDVEGKPRGTPDEVEPIELEFPADGKFYVVEVEAECCFLALYRDRKSGIRKRCEPSHFIDPPLTIGGLYVDPDFETPLTRDEAFRMVAERNAELVRHSDNWKFDRLGEIDRWAIVMQIGLRVSEKFDKAPFDIQFNGRVGAIEMPCHVAIRAVMPTPAEVARYGRAGEFQATFESMHAEAFDEVAANA